MPQSAAPESGSRGNGAPGLYGGPHRGPWDPAYAAGPWWVGPPRWVALWIPVIVSFLVQVTPFLLPPRFWPVLTHPGHPRESLWAVLLMLVGPIALMAARRLPGPVAAVVAAAATAAILFGDESWPPYIALGFAIVSAIVRGARTWAWASVAVAWVTTLVVVLVMGESWHPLRVAGTMLGILVVFGIGEGIRGRRDHMAEYRRMAAERRTSEVQAERVRIARELHDVLAHSLSQINVQAGVGLHLMDAQPQKAAEALASIKSTSKTALDEVRSVLGVLRAEDGADPSSPLVPEPDLARLPGLAASVTQQGVEVDLVDEIVDPPPAPTQLALYRIVQESLTNVLRHARATRATVRLEEAGGDYRVLVTDDGTAPADPAGAGRGLLGMAERAELLGGTFRAGPRAGGGFEVEARIPKAEARQ